MEFLLLVERQIRSAGMSALGAGQAEGEWHVDGIRYCFRRDPHTKTRTHILLLTDGQICILRPLRALISSETQNLGFLHTKAVFLLKEVNGTIQSAFESRAKSEGLLPKCLSEAAFQIAYFRLDT